MKSNNNVFLLGATGSVGKSVLEAISSLGLKLEGFTFHKNVVKAKKIIQQYQPQFAIATDVKSFNQIRKEPGKTQILFGLNAVLEKITECSASKVVNALSGLIGLLPSIETLNCNKRLIISNKESIVCGSKLLAIRQRYENQIIPIDSEHWSLFLLMENVKREKVKELIVTASGGPFRNFTQDQMDQITPEQALAHPVWHMGKSITVSSATMANKGLEVLEAKELFQYPLEKIKVIVHPQAKIHAMLRLLDGSLMAHMAKTSMVDPARNALNYPKMEPQDNFKCTDTVFDFYKADEKRFPLLKLAYEAGNKGHLYQIVYTAANELAVEYFLAQKISFNQMGTVVKKVMDSFENQAVKSVDEIFQINEQAKAKVKQIAEGE